MKSQKIEFVISKNRICDITEFIREAPGPSGRASNSRARGRGIDPHSGRRVVSLSKIHLPPKKSTGNTQERWLRPDMTEKLLTGT